MILKRGIAGTIADPGDADETSGREDERKREDSSLIDGYRGPSRDDPLDPRRRAPLGISKLTSVLPVFPSSRKLYLDTLVFSSMFNHSHWSVVSSITLQLTNIFQLTSYQPAKISFLMANETFGIIYE